MVQPCRDTAFLLSSVFSLPSFPGSIHFNLVKETKIPWLYKLLFLQLFSTQPVETRVHVNYLHSLTSCWVLRPLQPGFCPHFVTHASHAAVSSVLTANPAEVFWFSVYLLAFDVAMCALPFEVLLPGIPWPHTFLSHLPFWLLFLISSWDFLFTLAMLIWLRFLSWSFFSPTLLSRGLIDYRGFSFHLADD